MNTKITQDEFNELLKNALVNLFLSKAAEQEEPIEDLKPCEAKQLTLTKFCALYGIPKASALEYIRRKDDPLPAYKFKQWMVDMEKYPAWRKREHKRRFKYAT